MDEIVLTAEQLQCLASPACNDVVTALSSLVEASATEIAGKVERSPATVLYHLRRLVECSLVIEFGTRPTSRKPEALFRLAAKRLRLPQRKPGSKEDTYRRQAVIAGLRRVMRGFEKAAISAPEDETRIQVIRAQIRLSPENFTQFTQMIEAANQFAYDNRDEAVGTVHWSSVIYPDV